MVSNFHLPPAGFGPGSQPAPEDGADLSYIDLPGSMNTYTPHVPDIAVTEALGIFSLLVALILLFG